MKKSIARNLVLVSLGVVLGLGLARLAPESRAAERRAEIRLGHPAAFVLEQAGHPAKIAYGPEHQVWYYSDAQGQAQARFWLNEGLVVRID